MHIPVKSCVMPQGDHLCPFFFCVVINDFPNIIQHLVVLMYADDVNLFYSSHNFEDFRGMESNLCLFAGVI